MSDSCIGCRGSRERIGVLLAQLGTPDEPTGPALRRYLKQFLWDPRVIEVPRVLWWLILNGIILNTRPKRSARLYSRIWRPEGSPLLHYTNLQRDGILSRLADHGMESVDVVVGMRYGSPSIESALDNLMERGCSRILVIPMYPQYSAATTGSTYDAVFPHLLKRRWVPTLKVMAPFYGHELYQCALAQSINEYLANKDEKPQKLILSYHGVPEKYVERGDPYCCMCTETTHRLVPQLKFPAGDVIHTYQSRFGRDPWLIPYTDHTVEKLAEEGIKRIAVACPGFTADCLETLDEIGNEAREAFHEAGGEWLELIPCVNDHPAFIDALTSLIVEEFGMWRAPIEHPNRLDCPVVLAKARGLRG